MADDEMLKDHRQTFDGFIKVSIYSTILVIVILVGMAIFLL